MLCWGPYGR